MYEEDVFIEAIKLETLSKISGDELLQQLPKDLIWIKLYYYIILFYYSIL